MGFGNVGRALARSIRIEPLRFDTDIEIAAISDSTGISILAEPGQIESMLEWKESGRSLGKFPGSFPARNPSELIRILREIAVPVLVECLPTNILTGQPGLDLISAGLSHDISVVTVDKGPVVHGYHDLMDLAARSGKRLAYSGTLGVSPPDEIAGKRVLEIRGVLNGTTNYVLTEMQQGSQSFQDALSQAQRDGIAEPDPSLDVDGWDTAAKILILAKSLMSADSSLADVSRIGLGPEIESLIEEAKKSGRRVRLVGRARTWQSRVRVSVAPKLVGPDSPFYCVEGTSKAAVFRTEDNEFVVHSASGLGGICDTITADIARAARCLNDAATG
ncbi:MAG TPA: hypothetical protein VI756_05690 [Blastocatellia bacterium]